MQHIYRLKFKLAVLLTVTAPAAMTISAQKQAETRSYEQFALTQPGDAKRGRELFLDEKLTKCAVCHKLNGQGGEAGPDLSAIGGKFDRPHLIESLLEPSRQIVEGYRTTIITFKSGLGLTGIVKKRSDKSITLLDANSQRHVIELVDIDEQQDSGVSLMPLGLEKSLTPEQFADLVAMLETCRTGINPTPGSHVSGGISLPEDFQVQAVATGLTGATALETTLDGRVLVCEQTGTLRVVRDDILLVTPALTLPVEAWWERGLIGVTVDPDFPRTPHLYVCYVAKSPYPHHRISRLTMQGDLADPASEVLLLEGDDQRKLGGNVPAGHQGGALHFGSDGKLYIAIGEQTAGAPSQSLNTFQGKMLRINADGSIPNDNPFVSRAAGKYRAIWATGLRNPFTFAIRRGNSDMCINDIGGDKFEEINLGAAAANYGWPLAEGPSDDKRFMPPIHWYKAASVCGGDFIAGDSPWPAKYHGRYLFADYIHGWLRTLELSHPNDVQPFGAGLRNPVDLRFAQDGSLYVLLRNAWVIDDKFAGNTGSLLKISVKTDTRFSAYKTQR